MATKKADYFSLSAPELSGTDDSTTCSRSGTPSIDHCDNSSTNTSECTLSVCDSSDSEDEDGHSCCFPGAQSIEETIEVVPPSPSVLCTVIAWCISFWCFFSTFVFGSFMKQPRKLPGAIANADESKYYLCLRERPAVKSRRLRMEGRDTEYSTDSYSESESDDGSLNGDWVKERRQPFNRRALTEADSATRKSRTKQKGDHKLEGKRRHNSRGSRRCLSSYHPRRTPQTPGGQLHRLNSAAKPQASPSSPIEANPMTPRFPRGLSRSCKTAAKAFSKYPSTAYGLVANGSVTCYDYVTNSSVTSLTPLKPLGRKIKKKATYIANTPQQLARQHMLRAYPRRKKEHGEPEIRSDSDQEEDAATNSRSIFTRARATSLAQKLSNPFQGMGKTNGSGSNCSSDEWSTSSVASSSTTSLASNKSKASVVRFDLSQTKSRKDGTAAETRPVINSNATAAALPKSVRSIKETARRRALSLN